jgi:alanine racemase
MRATRALVHLDRLRSNIQAVKARVGAGTAVCVPIKADAYGHGAVRVAVAAIRAGATHLAVASVQEGVELREAGIVAPVLLLSLPILEELPDVVAYGMIPLVADADFARELAAEAARRGERTAVHLKIDTGMGRIGCRPEDAVELARTVAGLGSLRLEGCATHLSVSDSLDPDDLAYTRGQIAAFRAALDSIRAAGIDPGVAHAAASGGVALHPDSYFDMVRPGLLLYGYQPLAGYPDPLPVQPVMELETRIVFIKTVRAGEPVSYGRTWTAPRDTVLATLPVGYADGLARRLSGRLSVLIDGRTYPVVGRICMDQCMVDLGPADGPAAAAVRRWDVASVFGPDPRGASAADLARELGTIPYEITCAVNRRVPRVYID